MRHGPLIDTDGEFVVTFVGNVVAAKGPHFACQAADLAARLTGRPFRVRVGGDAWYGRGGVSLYESWLREQCATLQTPVEFAPMSTATASPTCSESHRRRASRARSRHCRVRRSRPWHRRFPSSARTSPVCVRSAATRSSPGPGRTSRRSPTRSRPSRRTPRSTPSGAGWCGSGRASSAGSGGVRARADLTAGHRQRRRVAQTPTPHTAAPVSA